jgi:hypothetical protein
MNGLTDQMVQRKIPLLPDGVKDSLKKVSLENLRKLEEDFQRVSVEIQKSDAQRTRFVAHLNQLQGAITQTREFCAQYGIDLMEIPPLEPEKKEMPAENPPAE